MTLETLISLGIAVLIILALWWYNKPRFNPCTDDKSGQYYFTIQLQNTLSNIRELTVDDAKTSNIPVDIISYDPFISGLDNMIQSCGDLATNLQRKEPDTQSMLKDAELLVKYFEKPELIQPRASISEAIKNDRSLHTLIADVFTKRDYANNIRQMWLS